MSGILLFRSLWRGMKGEKDEGKQMVPLFPGLHISDGDKGGPRAAPRNKMALFEEYSVNSQGPDLRPLQPVPANGCSNFFSQVAGVKRKVRPILASMNECPHSSEWCYSHSPGGVPGPSNYQNTSFSVQPPCYSNCCTDENDFAESSFLQSGKILNYGNLQLHVKKEKFDPFSSVSSAKLHGGSSKLAKETRSGDQAMGHHGNLGEESSKLSQNSVAGNRIQCNQLKKKSMGDETSGSNYPQPQLCLEFKSLHKSKTVADGMSAISGSSMRKSTSDSNQWAKIGLIKECSNDNDSLSLKIGDAVKSEETSDTILGLDLIPPDEVAGVIGQRLFLKARKTMVHQQKIFSLQMFELHRLITVQKHIARSPEILHENTFDPNKPSIKFPPINKLLYVSPLDPSPAVALKSNLGMDCGAEALRGLLPLPTTDAEKGHLAQPLTPKSLPNPASIPIDPKLAPWCFPVPTGNQWLVPVRSPSEGLIYKPYPGPCFPTVGFMGPVYGGLSSLGGGATYSTELSQSYLQPYAMPPINPTSPNPDLISSAGAQAGELDKTSTTRNSNFFVPHQIPSKVSSQPSAVVSECGGNLHRSNGSEMQGSSTETSPTERLEGDALSLFPTTPSLQALRNEQRVHAIKVVPHNRMSASASAARIFQSIQKERRKHEILLELAVRAVGEKNTTCIFNYVNLLIGLFIYFF